MDSNLVLFSGTSHPALAEAVAKHLGVEVTPMDIKRFACGEVYTKAIPSVRGKDVYIIQTGTHNVNEDLMELFVMIDAVKRSFAKNVRVIVPHFPYARQDRVAQPREPITAKLVAKLIEESGADHVISFGLHSAQIQGFFDRPMDNLSANKLFIDYFESKDFDDLVVVSPDAGGAKEAKKFADALGAGLAILNKTRSEHNKSEITHVVGDVEGKTCIIFDDMVDTAGSVCNAKKALEQSGADGDIFLAATHAVFSDPATERLSEAGFKEIVVSDTIPLNDKKMAIPGLTVLSIAPFIAKIIESVHMDKSVTDVIS
jgi:ribose-phosphate pyrophosphokinase